MSAFFKLHNNQAPTRTYSHHNTISLININSAITYISFQIQANEMVVYLTNILIL